MRVCHVWQNFYPIEFGGVERYILGLSDFLYKKDNTQFSLISDKGAYVPLSQGLRIAKFQRINCVDVNRLGPNISSIIDGSYFRILHRRSKNLDNMLGNSLFREAEGIQGVDAVDIFHVHGFWQPLYPSIGLKLSQRFHRPFVLTLHGDSTNPNDPFAMPLRAPTTVDILKCADAITTFSKETFRILQEIGLEKKSWLIPNFIDTLAFRRPAISTGSTDGTRIVMISRLSRPKDPITPIRAFAQVKREFPEATFTIVGYGPLYNYMTNLVRNLGLTKEVTFVGMRSNVNNFLWNSDIYIGTRGSYITTLEAWSAGNVVLAPKFGIMEELISNGTDGLLTSPGNAEELAKVIIDLIKNKSLRSTLVSNGKAAAERQDIRNVVPIIANIYKSLT